MSKQKKGKKRSKNDKRKKEIKRLLGLHNSGLLILHALCSELAERVSAAGREVNAYLHEENPLDLDELELRYVLWVLALTRPEPSFEKNLYWVELAARSISTKDGWEYMGATLGNDGELHLRFHSSVYSRTCRISLLNWLVG